MKDTLAQQAEAVAANGHLTHPNPEFLFVRLTDLFTRLGGFLAEIKQMGDIVNKMVPAPSTPAAAVVPPPPKVEVPVPPPPEAPTKGKK